MEEKIYQFYALSEGDTPQEYRYIGVTSTTINIRFSQHKYCATHPEKCGLPVHKWMSSVYKKGGTILYQKIDQCKESEWERRETFLIQKYKDLGYKLLNLDKGGKGVITAEKRSKSSIQRSIEGHLKKIVLIEQISKITHICNSVIEAHEVYGLSKTAIGNVLSGRAKTTGGYYVVDYNTYISSEFNIDTYIQSRNNQVKKGKTIYQYNLEGILLKTFKNQSDATNYGFDDGAIRRAIKNKTIYKDSYWSYFNTIELKDFKSIYKYEYNGTKFRTLHEIATLVGLKDCTISNALRENRPIKGVIINRI